MSEQDHKLGELSKLANEIPHLLAQIELKKKELKEAEEKHRIVIEDLIPDLMAQLGITEIKTEDGSSLSVSKQFFAKIPKEKEKEAFSWLKDHGFSSLIKTKVIESTGVHHQTLKAFVKEQMEMGNEVPQELFGVFVKQVTKITK